MELKHRTPTVEAHQFIYQSDSHAFAEKHGGLVDKVTGDVYIQTSAGVRILPYGSWIVREDDVVSIMTEAEVFKAFEPVDVEEAFNTLGFRQWPAMGCSVQRIGYLMPPTFLHLKLARDPMRSNFLLNALAQEDVTDRPQLRVGEHCYLLVGADGSGDGLSLDFDLVPPEQHAEMVLSSEGARVVREVVEKTSTRSMGC